MKDVPPTVESLSTPEMSAVRPVAVLDTHDAPPSGVRRFFQNAGVIAGAEVIARLKGLVILPLLTHHLGALDYGVWSQVLLLVTFVPMLMLLGTDSALVRFLPGVPIEVQRRHFAGWLVVMLAAAAGFALVLYVARGPVSVVFFGSKGEYERFIPLAAATIWVNVLVTGIRNWYRIRNDAWWFSAVTLGQAAFSLAATVVVLVYNESVFELVMYLLLADLLLAAVLGATIARREGVARPDYSWLRKFVRFGLPLVPAGFAVWGLNWLDRLFMVQYSSLDDIGVYSLAYGLGYMAIQLIANPLFTMFPTAASADWNRGHPDGVQHLFERTAGATLFLMLPTVAATIVLGPAIVAFLAPPTFAAAATVMPIVMVGYLFLMLAAYYEVAFGLIERQWLSTAAVVVAVIVNIPLNFLLIPPYSLYGAAIATSVAFLAQLVFVVAVTARLRTLRTPWRRPARMMLASLAMAAGVWGIGEVVGVQGLPRLFVLSAIGALLYAVLAIVLRALPTELIPRTPAQARALFGRPQVDVSVPPPGTSDA
jgi:O-antigen/teichoic acid export membrane protein